MPKLVRLTALAVATSTSVAQAAPIVLYPVQTGLETVRFMKGVPTLNLETPTGAIQVTPLPFDHDHVVFGVGVYNKGATPANFGIENVSAVLGIEGVSILSETELERRAKSRATWSAIGVALLAGAAAAASANAYTTQTNHGTLLTPHGAYRWTSSYRDNTIGVLGSAAAVGGGAAAIVGIQNRLDYTLANYANDVVQTTTIEPDSSYGGRIVLEKPKKTAKMPYDVRITLKYNGNDYPFVFRVTKEGTNVPAAYTTAPTPMPVQATAAVAPTPATGGAIIVPALIVPVPVQAPANATAPKGSAPIAKPVTTAATTAI